MEKNNIQRLSEKETEILQKLIDNLKIGDFGYYKLKTNVEKDMAVFYLNTGEEHHFMDLSVMLNKMKDYLDYFAPQYYSLTDEEAEIIYKIFERYDMNVRGRYFNTEYDIDGKGEELYRSLSYAKTYEEAEKILSYIIYDFEKAGTNRTVTANELAWSKIYVEDLKERKDFNIPDNEQSLADIKMQIFEAEKDTSHREAYNEMVLDGTEYTVIYDNSSDTLTIGFDKPNEDFTAHSYNTVQWSKDEVMGWNRKDLVDRLNSMQFYAYEEPYEEETEEETIEDISH